MAAVGIPCGVLEALRLASFVASFIPKQPVAVTGFIVAVGQDSFANDPASLSGNIPAISIFVIDGGSSFNGGNSRKTRRSGSMNSVAIDNYHGVEDVQTDYVKISESRTDVICISATELKNLSSNDSFGRLRIWDKLMGWNSTFLKRQLVTRQTPRNTGQNVFRQAISDPKTISKPWYLACISSTLATPPPLTHNNMRIILPSCVTVHAFLHGQQHI